LESIVAVRVTLESGRSRYFLAPTCRTLSEEELELYILSNCKKFALGGKPKRALVCQSLQAAARQKYFYECLIDLQRQPAIPVRQMKRLLSLGKLMSFCG